MTAALAPAMVVMVAFDDVTAGLAVAMVVTAAAALLGGAVDRLLLASESGGGRPIPPLRANISLILGGFARVPEPLPLVLGF